MKRNISIQIKAALLLVVFGLNTLVGFACAVGLDMHFNNSHHSEEEATETHVHTDGKSHHHEKNAQESSHGQNKDDCCNDNVLKISQDSKVVPQTVKVINPLFFTAFVVSFYEIFIGDPSQVNTSDKYFLRGYHPPIRDIRIAISSFQI